MCKKRFMINNQLICPDSIAVIGASNNIMKPGGKIVKNLTDNNYSGKLYLVNPGEDLIQGIPAFHRTEDLPETDLAVLAIPARYCLDEVKILAEQKGTKAFIIISAGFSETGTEGKRMEREITESFILINTQRLQDCGH